MLTHWANNDKIELQRKSQHMVYSFSSDQKTEFPFYQEMGKRLNGKEIKDNFNRKKSYRYCECPKCGKKESSLFPSRRGDTYVFHCPRQTCSMGSMTLHNLIKEHGGSDLFQRWRETRWKKKEPYGWKGIKNRRQ